MNIAQGSIEECRYYLILSQDLKYGSASGLIDQLEEVAKLLDSYLQAIVSASNWMAEVNNTFPENHIQSDSCLRLLTSVFCLRLLSPVFSQGGGRKLKSRHREMVQPHE